MLEGPRINNLRLNVTCLADNIRTIWQHTIQMYQVPRIKEDHLS
jgi:hypothetical protein